MLGQMLGQATSAFGYMLVMGAPTFLILAYFFITWDKRRPDSENADDTQVGLKLGLFFLALVGLGMATSGGSSFMHYLFSGTKIGSGAIKSGIASILTGLIVLGGVWFVFLPRTNYAEYPKATRYALGYVAVISGMIAALSLNGFVDGLFNSAAWRGNSGNFANLLVFGGLGVVALMRFGSLSGWAAPAPRQFSGGGGFAGPGQGGFPPQGGQGPQGGFPPQGGQPGPQGGFPPQGGQPQGGQPQGGQPGPQGGFPPQGGQGPGPQGGGFPAPGGGGPGGAPPQGGGGLPPPSGSGGGFPR